ncbi:bacteriohemerythrin [Magnetospira thiophila]
MIVLPWTEDFKVGVDFMDEDHQEAVDLINRMAETSGSERRELMAKFLDHCTAHFAREEEMMRQIGFFAYPMHQGEHERVLAELRVVLSRLDSGEEDQLSAYFTTALPNWLIDHRNTMDMITATFSLQFKASQ